MIGLGTQDDLAFAQRFVDQFGVTFSMTWDPSFRSWNELGIRGQPASVLIGTDGEILGSWVGVDESAVLGLI